jgi:hypothetical protein
MNEMSEWNLICNQLPSRDGRFIGYCIMEGKTGEVEYDELQQSFSFVDSRKHDCDIVAWKELPLSPTVDFLRQDPNLTDWFKL